MRAGVMGVLNVTPDSFSDGGQWLDLDAAVAHGLGMLDDGAVVVDVGGESTRPGADPVDVAAETARVVPVIEALAAPVAAAGARISVDTRRPEVARAAVAAGASIVNDVSASLAGVAAETGAGWVAMHMRGEPSTMQRDPRYHDVVAEVLDHLVARGEAARALGVSEVWIDPGIGFGKTFAHNWALLAALDRFVATGFPVVVGASRKTFLGDVLARSDARGARAEPAPVAPDDRLEGSLAVATWAASLGASLIRCHDVRPTAHALRVVGDARPDCIVAPEVA